MEEIIKETIGSKSLLVDEEDIQKMDTEILVRAEEETKTDIPIDYIKIKLPSNGRIKGIPKELHFRDYSVAESLELNTPIREDRPKAICAVLTKMCFEKFDIGKLPIQDILFILYSIQANFISNDIVKSIYVDDSLPRGYEKGQLNNEDNIEEVNIPISSLNFIFLGKDENDKDLKEHIKIPFKIKDTKSKKEIGFKIASLEDAILARNYCKDLFSEELASYSAVRTNIDMINDIRDNNKREKAMDDYLSSNYDLCNDYYKFIRIYEDRVAQVIQALQIVSYNGEEITDISKKWEIYSTQVTAGIWDTYIKVTEKYKFGIKNEMEVYSNKLGKKVVRTFGFQLFDFISVDRPQDTDRYDVLFD